MNSQTRNRLLGAVALLIAGGALAVISFSNVGQNLVYYWNPQELHSAGAKAYGPTIRLGGMVQKGSIVWNPEHTELHFRVANGMNPNAESVPVKCTEVPPQMFREGIGVVVEGTYGRDNIFTSSRLMVKHSNEYRAPKPGEMPEHDDWKKSFEQADAKSPETAK